MNKLFFTKAIFLVILFVIGISSCETDFYAVDTTNGYKKFYSSRDNFENGWADITPNSNMLSGSLMGHLMFAIPITKADHINTLPSIYYDGRDSLGNSTWSDPAVTYDASSATVTDYKEGLFLYHIKVNVSKGLNTPPAHLHLCLRKWDEDTWYSDSPLSWRIKSIVDDKGKDLTKDPEWNCYSDNMMQFMKADRFYFFPGRLRSPKELKLFGTESENYMIIGSYKVAKTTTGEVQLTLVFPNFNTTLTVLESRFGYIKLSGVSDGKKGILELTPYN